MEKSVRHYSIPVFVPHEGCPNTCLFCNQRSISGKERFDIGTVRQEIDTCLSTIKDAEVQIAFFGGSFTAIDRSLMLSLLEISDEYVERGLVQSVRLSTRPDAVGKDVLKVLKEHHVRDVELGIQSLDDKVLCLNRRGHTSQCALDAMKRVVDEGFNLTGQMMTGMYGATGESELFTAEKIVECGAGSARIYPTVVFRNTALDDIKNKGLFVPLTLDESVERTLGAYRIFKRAGVKVIRIGLCSADNVRGEDATSLYHEAIGELVLCRDRRDIAEEYILSHPTEKGGVLEIPVDKKEVSLFVGQRKANREYLEEKYKIKIKFVF